MRCRCAAAKHIGDAAAGIIHQDARRAGLAARDFPRCLKSRTGVGVAIVADVHFHFQRALMSGGTCEATAYQEFGLQTGAVCVALGNYHNCASKQKIAAEFVSVSDACGMVRLLVEAARQMPRYATLIARLPKSLQKLHTTARKALRRKS